MSPETPLQPPGDTSEEPSAPGSSPFLKFGALAVLGAVAANVFGFRYSRWAVGKEIHRGWERHARNQARSSARARADGRREQSARAQEHARARQQRQAEREREHARREDAARREREKMRGAYREWEETFSNGGYTRRVRVEFDSRFEDMFRGPFGVPEEVLREFLRAAEGAQRAAEGAQRAGRARGADFDAFRFWEQVHGAEWHRGGMGGTGAPGGVGGSFRRAGLARHYAVLGVAENASAEEIKAAYRREAMKWHPDRYRGNDKAGAERRFREVTEAYKALKQ